MRVVKTVTTVGPRDGEHYGIGYAVAFHTSETGPQSYRVSSIFSHEIRAGVVCVVVTCGSHEIIVQTDPPGPERPT